MSDPMPDKKNERENQNLYRYVLSTLNDDENTEEIQTKEISTFMRLIGRNPSDSEIKIMVKRAHIFLLHDLNKFSLFFLDFEIRPAEYRLS